MSNQLAIATVTASIAHMIEVAIKSDTSIPSVSILTMRPQNPLPPEAQPTGLFLYLYQVMPNAALRGADLPTRRGDGSVAQRPQIALNLYYLLSFFGEEKVYLPQRLLGIVVRALHSQAIITSGVIEKVKTTIDSPLKDTDLDVASERVRLTPVSFSLEDLSKLWSVYIQSPYLLSVAYEASAVLIEDIVIPEPVLPVLESGLFGVSFLQPVIESAEPAGGGAEAAVMGTLLCLDGTNLKGKITRVRIGEMEGEPSQLSDSRIAVALAEPPFTTGSLRAGITGAQVIHYEEIGLDSRLFTVAESNVVPFMFRPKLTDPPVFTATPNRIKVKVAPIVGARQRVSLQLLSLSSGKSHSFDAPGRASDTAQLEIPIPGAPAGKYLIRLRVDGADSPLDVEKDPSSPDFKKFIGPAVVVGP